ncbi:MAG TPA: hypothetical protein PLJ39_03330 [Spirochaetota bacterium]|nr:hypothetical protein [Spirochaetota bacterium]
MKIRYYLGFSASSQLGLSIKNISYFLDRLYFSPKLAVIMEELDGYCSRDVPVPGIIFVILFL